MFPIFWASAVASIGWLWVAESLPARYRNVKYTTRMGTMAQVETRWKKWQPVSRVVLLIVAILSVLPFGAIVISQTWLSTAILIVLTLLLLGVWLFFSPYATPIYTETGRTATGDGDANIEYKLEKFEQNHIKVLAVLLVPVAVWAAVTWILSMLGLRDWILIGATNAIGITLTIVFITVGGGSFEDFTK